MERRRDALMTRAWKFVRALARTLIIIYGRWTSIKHRACFSFLSARRAEDSRPRPRAVRVDDTHATGLLPRDVRRRHGDPGPFTWTFGRASVRLSAELLRVIQVNVPIVQQLNGSRVYDYNSTSQPSG